MVAAFAGESAHAFFLHVSGDLCHSVHVLADIRAALLLRQLTRQTENGAGGAMQPIPAWATNSTSITISSLPCWHPHAVCCGDIETPTIFLLIKQVLHESLTLVACCLLPPCSRRCSKLRMCHIHNAHTPRPQVRGRGCLKRKLPIDLSMTPWRGWARGVGTSARPGRLNQGVYSAWPPPGYFPWVGSDNSYNICMHDAATLTALAPDTSRSLSGMGGFPFCVLSCSAFSFI